MITFNELFEDPDAEYLIKHIIDQIEPTGTRSEIINRSEKLSLSTEIAFWSRYSIDSSHYQAIDVRDAFYGYKEYKDYRLAVVAGFVRRIYITNPEMIVDNNIVGFLKEFTK